MPRIIRSGLTIRSFRSVSFSILLVACAPTGAIGWRQSPRMEDIDRVRIAEAFRLAAKLGNRVWKNWDKAPFAILLITQDQEFLIRHPKPPADFTRSGFDPVLAGDFYFRKRVLPPNLLATFPLDGVATVVVGRAENTSSKTSSPWVAAVLHEHFHQLQYSQPDYFTKVAALGLTGGDKTGMWMLNFPFPYGDPLTGRRFSELCRSLAAALDARPDADLGKKLRGYVDIRRKFTDSLKADDYKYLSFQLWQEGVARYVEWRMAKAAASEYRPSKQFVALADYTAFASVADSILGRISNDLDDAKLSKRERTAFYSLGAAEAMLADLAGSKWKKRYFENPLSTEGYLVSRPTG